MIHTEINTLQELANYLRCPIDFLEKATQNDFDVVDLAKGDKLRIPPSGGLVSVVRVAKKGKKIGHRIVYKVLTDQLSNTLKILNTYLREIYVPENCVHGFVKKKTIKTNAEMHLAKKIVISVDIENFFENVTRLMVIEGLISIGFKPQIADWLSQLTTIHNALVQGFSTSPILANIVSVKLDQELLSFCEDKVTYSRYADDLYFSSNDDIIDLAGIEKIVNLYSFKLNHSKTKVMKRGQPQYVTGLTVFDKNTARIAKRIKRNLRLEIYHISKFGYRRHVRVMLKKAGFDSKSPDFHFEVDFEIANTINRIYGWLYFIYSVEPEFTNKYYKILNKTKPKYYSLKIVS